MIDVHAHLNLLRSETSWREIFERSRAKGVQACVVPGADMASSRAAVQLASEEPGLLFAAVGLHPNHVAPRILTKEKQALAEGEGFEWFDYDAYLELAKKTEVVAIGEVGLDRYRSAQSMEEQLEVLRQFIAISLEVNKPLILHVRAGKTPRDVVVEDNPHDVTIELLTNLPQRPRFVVHCYQGTPEQAARYIELGGMISFTGTVTYSDESVVIDAIKLVPDSQLLVETDTPFLSPVPYRGEVNEPWKVSAIIERVAEVRGASASEIDRLTTANAIRFFSLPNGDGDKV